MISLASVAEVVSNGNVINNSLVITVAGSILLTLPVSICIHKKGFTRYLKRNARTRRNILFSNTAEF
jgi:hypothetical protein